MHQAFPKREFEETKRLNPFWSDWVCFCEVVRGKKNLHPRTLRKRFNELVSKQEYSKSDRGQLIQHLLDLRK